MDLESAVIWPMLKGAPERMLLLLNLHANRRMCTVNDPFLATEQAREASLLLLQGSASIWNAHGEMVQPLQQGECFNEQILLGYPNYHGEYVVPTSVCEVQIVTKQAWDKVCHEFAQEQETVCKSNEFAQEQEIVCKAIVKHMSKRAEIRLGHTPGGTTMLKSSALFRGTPEPFLQSVRDHVEHILYMPADSIIEAGKTGNGFYLLLDGTADATLREQVFELTAGANFGEAVLIGIVKKFQKTVTARTLCLVQKLKRTDFKNCLEEFPGTERYFECPVMEAKEKNHDSLPNRVRSCKCFEGCDPAFLDIVCQHVDDHFFVPQEIISSSEPSLHGFNNHSELMLGVSFVYVLLAGQAVQEDELGVTLGEVNIGEVIGEGPVVGMSDGSITNVRAWNRGLVHCARIPSNVLREQLENFPQEKDHLLNRYTFRQSRNQEKIARRSMWLNEVAVPSLRSSVLFSWCDLQLMQFVAANLAESEFAPGMPIAVAGDDANSMFVLLDGVADIESKCGMHVGTLRDGAIIGEVAIMGLFSTRTATVRAQDRCRVIEISADIFELKRKPDYEEIIKTKLAQKADERHIQIMNGLPLSALPLAIPAGDVCVRAVALQADRINLLPGEHLEPMSDRSACGPHFSVLVRGRAHVEMSCDSRDVMALMPGSLIIEGLLAEFDAQVSAKSACELYRVRQSDFMIAVLSVPAAHEWFYRYRLLERETKDRFLTRLKSAQGAKNASSRRPASASAGRPLYLLDTAETKPPSRPGTAPQGIPRGERQRMQHGSGSVVSLKALKLNDSKGDTCSRRPMQRVGSAPACGRRGGKPRKSFPKSFQLLKDASDSNSEYQRSSLPLVVQAA